MNLRKSARLSLMFFFATAGPANGQAPSPAQAQALEQQGNLAEAEQAWRKITEANPKDAAAFASLGLVLSRQGKYEQAVPAYKRILLKLSGEALMGDDAYGINREVIDRIVAEIGEIVQLGVQVAVVIGGGNIFRGVAPGAAGMDRADGCLRSSRLVPSCAIARRTNDRLRAGRDRRIVLRARVRLYSRVRAASGDSDLLRNVGVGC